ncbi:2-hydroxychromene-2-carboxylate isomerase [Dyella caseinilytica]|uniref:2-hydroxychromene-2-carboxylate isomerase n=1 Tax=Dyella caseinilytica TaxID=1849581 RepID=A0ABX7GVV6_9GAMM|nr:2-hydroxychromene-2-carboxylate isomerase [Dyella caseinilytica]QRN54435.1 2-hydroxychromene-2-carboxylate isomerase [Dyella caseinilytica]GFZ94211.1 isomerase [Dyella caseinilytica]
MTASTPITFYFDPVSPYAWLAMEQVDRIIAAGGQLNCRPILFAALLNTYGTKGPAEIPVKRAYVFRDVMRQAQQLGLPFRGPPSHPFNPLAALRAMHTVEDGTQRLAMARSLLAAAWRDGIDIADPHRLHDVLANNGFDADAISAASGSPEVKQRLRDTTQQAIDTGVFGVPTFLLLGELFWGADRVDAVIWALKGGAIDETLYRDALARPAGAQR